MRLRELEVFNAVMSTGSMTEAANRLHVTQPAVSKTIRDMEAGFGFDLFSRAGNRLVPTTEAAVLQDEVARIFEKVSVVEQLVHDLRGNKRGRLVIAASAALAHTILPAAVARFKTQHADVGISIRCLAVPEVAKAVERQEAHIGLTYSWTIDTGTMPPAAAAGDAAGRRRVEIACVMPDDHPLAQREAVTFGDLRNQQVITYVDSTPLGQIVAEVMGRQTLSSLSPIQVSFAMTAAHLALELKGVALIAPDILGRRGMERLTSRPLRPPIAAWFQTRILRGTSFSRLSDGFIHALQELAPDYALSDVGGDGA